MFLIKGNALITANLAFLTLQIRAIILLLLFVPDVLFANQEISIAVNHITNLLEEKNPDKGYSKILYRMTAEQGPTVNIQFFPGSRAGRNFIEKKSTCLFPNSKKSHPNDDAIIESLPINVATAFIFSKKPFRIDKVLEKQAPKLSIAFKRGNTYGGTLKHLEHHVLLAVDTDKQAFGMLQKSRVDLAIGYMPDIGLLLSKESMQDLFYDKKKPFYAQNDSLVCHQTPLTEEFIKNINLTIGSMVASGELASMLATF